MGDSYDKRNAERTAGAALAGKKNPELGARLGRQAQEMAESMSSDDLRQIAGLQTDAGEQGGKPK